MGTYMRPDMFKAKAERAPAWPSPKTQPEDVFLAWLLELPHGADVKAAAEREVARLNRASASPAIRRLLELMREAAKG